MDTMISVQYIIITDTNYDNRTILQQELVSDSVSNKIRNHIKS